MAEPRCHRLQLVPPGLVSGQPARTPVPRRIRDWRPRVTQKHLSPTLRREPRCPSSSAQGTHTGSESVQEALKQPIQQHRMTARDAGGGRTPGPVRRRSHPQRRRIGGDRDAPVPSLEPEPELPGGESPLREAPSRRSRLPGILLRRPCSTAKETTAAGSPRRGRRPHGNPEPPARAVRRRAAASAGCPGLMPARPRRSWRPGRPRNGACSRVLPHAGE